MREQGVVHPSESYEDRCSEILDKTDWTSDNVGLAFGQFVSNFAMLVSNGCDLDDAIPTWNRKGDLSQTNVFGGSFRSGEVEVVARYQRVDGINGSNEFSLLIKRDDSPVRNELLYISQITNGKVYFQPTITSDLVSDGQVLEYAPMVLTPDLVRAGCVNVWNLYCDGDEDFEDEEESDEDREERIYDGLYDLFENPPEYNDTNARKLELAIKRMRREGFEGNLPYGEISWVVISALERSQENLAGCSHVDAESDLREDVDYWQGMNVLLNRIMRAEATYKVNRESRGK